MKKVLFIVVSILAMIGFTACGPYCTEKTEEIKNNETAFVVPLEGDTMAKQGQFMSIEYLDKAKIAAKRITIPQRIKSLGRASWDYEWIPTVRIIKVDRAPQTREWIGKSGISVESNESVGFTVGISVTAMIKEENASKFLYYYAGGDLKDVMDKNVKGYIQNILAREFGNRSVDECIKKKSEIVTILSEDCKKYFDVYGITISSIGISDGLSFENKEVQDTIDSVFVNMTVIKQAEQKRDAQKILNETELSIAKNERAKAEEFAKAAQAQTAMIDLKIKQMQAEANLMSAKKWNGQVPTSVVPAGSNFLFQFK